MTPQLRSRELLTDQGYLVATVEAHRHFPKAGLHPCRLCGQVPEIRIKNDLWGWADLIAEHPILKERMYVQVTSSTNHATRRNKILASFEAKLVLLAGASIEIHSWRKDERANRWMVRREQITLKDFQQARHYPSTVYELLEIRRKAKRSDLPPGASLKFNAGDWDDLPF